MSKMKDLYTTIQSAVEVGDVDTIMQIIDELIKKPAR